MIAESINSVLKQYNNTEVLLNFYDSKFVIEELECRQWRPSYSDREWMGDEEFDKQVEEWKVAKDKILFKNVFLSWDSCGCGESGYGCNCGDYVIEISIMKLDKVEEYSNLINRIQDKAKNEKIEKSSWIFSIEENSYYSEDVPFSTFHLPIPKTIGQFVSDCERVGATLIWNDWVVNNYFKSKNKIEKKQEIQLELF